MRLDAQVGVVTMEKMAMRWSWLGGSREEVEVLRVCWRKVEKEKLGVNEKKREFWS